MPLVKVICKKCNESSKIDIGDYSKEKVEEWLKQDGGFECFGHHVEFGSRDKYWTIDWDSIEESTAPTEEEFISELKSKYDEVYETKELQNHYKVVNFAYGLCVVENKENQKEKTFDFTQSPSGKRYYFAN